MEKSGVVSLGGSDVHQNTIEMRRQGAPPFVWVGALDREANGLFASDYRGRTELTRQVENPKRSDDDHEYFGRDQ
jgi:hypothetical protein